MWNEALERAAANGQPMPDGLNAPEKMLYVAMRGLYYQYRAGVLDQEQARREKRLLMNDFGAAELQMKSWEKSIKAWRWLNLTLEEDGCPKCRAMKEAILGLENAF